MPSPATKRKIFRIVPYGIIWFSFSLVYTIVEKGLLGPATTYPSTGNPYSFARNIYISRRGNSLRIAPYLHITERDITRLAEAVDHVMK